jgi:hypothetical protein
MSWRVISSGYEPPVSSKSVRLSVPSSVRYFSMGLLQLCILLTNVEAFGHAREIPYWLNSDLGNSNISHFADANLAIDGDAAFFHTVLHLWHLHVGTGDGNGRPDLDIVLVHCLLEQPWSEMTIRIHSYNLLFVAPLWERSNLRSRFGVGEVWLMGDVEVLACYGKRIVD